MWTRSDSLSIDPFIDPFSTGDPFVEDPFGEFAPALGSRGGEKVKGSADDKREWKKLKHNKDREVQSEKREKRSRCNEKC